MLNADAPQHMQAIARANEVRLAWSAYRRDLEAMSSYDAAHEVAALLDTHARGLESDALDAAAPYPIGRVIAAVKRMGPARLRRMADSYGLARVVNRPGLLKVRDLTPHEAFALADGLRLAYPVSPDAGTNTQGDNQHG